jgi:hypothetical protein
VGTESAVAQGRAVEHGGERSGHLWVSRALIALATVLLVVGALGIWVKRVALDSGNWGDTSRQVLSDPTVQATLSSYVVDQVYDNVDVAATLQAALPPSAQPLAPAAATGLRDLGERAALRALQSERVQDAWVRANVAANRQVVALLDGGSGALRTTNGDVVLDLHALLQQVEERTGLGGRVEAALPPSSGQIVLMHSDQLEAAQTATHALRVVSDVIVVLVLALFAAAIWLAPDRRRALRGCALGLLVAGLVLVVVRRVLGDRLIDDLVASSALRPTVHSVWWIATEQLRLITTTLIVVGLIALAGTALAGPGEHAVAARRWLAPYLRRAVVAYGALAAVVLVLLAWAPVPAAHNPITTPILVALAVVGVELIRRQTARESVATA